MTAKNNLIPLGHISAAHGIKGEVLVKTYTEAPKNIATYGPLSNEDGTAQIELAIVRITNKGVIARVEGVGDRNGAEALKGTKLCVPRDKLPEPDEDEWYYSDLIGLAVYDADGIKLGTIQNMHNFGAGDLMEFQRLPGGASELLAFNRETVPTVDIAAQRVTVVLPQEVIAAAPEGNRSAPDTAGRTRGKNDKAEGQ